MTTENLPPRLRKTKSLRIDKATSSIEILQQMGFSQHRSEKAIAATGDRGVQLASDWLLSHVNDSFLDDYSPREYVLYLCPNGALQKQLMAFWEKSLADCGWNGAHMYFPHITVCPFFTVPDSKTTIVKRALHKLDIDESGTIVFGPSVIVSVPDSKTTTVKRALHKLETRLSQAPGRLQLDFFTQGNFVGLFLQDVYYRYMCDILTAFAADVKPEGIKVEPPKKQLHITLAYQLLADHNDAINKLAKEVDLTADCHWDLRLYSRDARLGKSEVRKVIKAYKGEMDDELDLIMGDYVFMDTDEITRSQDGWYHGCSWVTGMMGMYPGTYTQRTAETWTWTLHGSVPLHECSNGLTEGATGSSAGDDLYDNLWKADALYAKVNKKKQNSVEEKKKLSPRQLYVMRHGERMDFCFGRGWLDMCFDREGTYKPTDTNMPRKIYQRTNNWDYAKDAPLTTIGQVQAHLTGEALKASGVQIHHVYVSPALRCVQTVTAALKAMGQSRVLRIEPGIFEWLGWYQLGLPKWFTPAELKDHGFNIDTSYKPFIPIAKYNMDETIEGYYTRSGETARHIIQLHAQEGGNVLLLGHAGSLEVCTRQLVGKTPRLSADFCELCSKVPYCSILQCQEDAATKKWSVCDSPVPTMTHGQNRRIAVQKMLYPS